jgi:hypothetical protein
MVTWAVTVALGVTVIMLTRTNPPAVHTAVPSQIQKSWAQPLVNERATTVLRAERQVGFRIFMPNSALASKHNLNKVWVNRQGQVALIFDGGKITVMMWSATYVNPAHWFRYVVHEIGSDAVLGRVDRYPAVFVRPNSEQSNPAWIEFYRDGADVNVVSTAYPVNRLLPVADSIMTALH